jgi:hypothetical protein
VQHQAAVERAERASLDARAEKPGEIVQLLVDRGARLDQRDKVYQGTPLGWAEHGGRNNVAAYLLSRGTGPKVD